MTRVNNFFVCSFHPGKKIESPDNSAIKPLQNLDYTYKVTEIKKPIEIQTAVLLMIHQGMEPILVDQIFSEISGVITSPNETRVLHDLAVDASLRASTRVDEL